MLKLDFPVKIPSRKLIYAATFHYEEMKVTSLVSGWKTLGLPASLNLTFLQKISQTNSNTIFQTS